MENRAIYSKPWEEHCREAGDKREADIDWTQTSAKEGTQHTHVYTKDNQSGQQEAAQGSGRQAQAHHAKNHPQEDKPGKRESGPRHTKTIRNTWK